MACAQLEARVGEHLVLQRDLNEAKARVDDELHQFRVIQDFIEKSLAAESDADFFDLTTEAIVEAFELEAVLILRFGEDAGVLKVDASFGLDDAPATLPFTDRWVELDGTRVLSAEDPLLADWQSLALHQAIVCPLRDRNNEPDGFIVGGVTGGNKDIFAPIDEAKGAAFTIVVRQAGSVLNHRALNADLLERNRQLEVEHGRQIVMQRDLARAKDQVDDELMRFKSIQGYISNALAVETDGGFFGLTLEAIIEAFELETAIFLQLDDDDPGRMRVASQFGFAEVPDSLPYIPEWFSGHDGWIAGPGNDFLTHWSDLDLATAIVCPFHDREDRLAGAVLAGVTKENMDFYEEIRPEILVPFSVLVRQAGGLWVNRQLNAEVLAQYRQLESLTESYSRFVPFQFLDLLGRSSVEEIATGDSTLRTMSVLFADIRGFTTLSEQLGPKEIFVSLNAFLAVMEPLIARENGFINQYLGDAIMALFPESADAALRCAQAMMETQVAFNRQREAAGDRPIHFGLGINTGPLTIGALGGGKRLDSNVIGDTVNLASRAEGLTKIYGVPAIFTDGTRALLDAPDSLSFREIDRVIVKGRATAGTIYELMRPALAAERADPERFADALREYRDGDFLKALTMFSDCLGNAPDDPVPAVYLQRCERFLENPPSEWDGVWSLDEKG